MSRELCGCGAPVFQGDDDVCDNCAREHRAGLLKVAEQAYDDLEWHRAQSLNGASTEDFWTEKDEDRWIALRDAIIKADP